jgi:phosphomannomutase
MTVPGATTDSPADASPYSVPHDLLERATSWRDDDPDEATRAELDAVLEAARSGDAGAGADLADRFAGMLEFGTAGLRGAMGAGPNRMNRSVVIRAAAGLTAYLQETTPEPLVVIGFDARHSSDVFATDTAAVVVAAGGRAMVLPRPLPTPVLAFAIRHLGADAGVMVTASHNPARDNGYKVYLGDGSQIVPPSDSQIAAHIAEVDLVADVPRAGCGWTTLNDDVLEAYLDAAAAVVAPDSARKLRIVHTALHGVGSDVVVAAFARAGFSPPVVVPSQSEPDPDFPTVSFPNPEEPGAIDAALALATRIHPDLVLANDPDADRCAVAVPDPGAATETSTETSTVANPSGWRMLRGDEVGALLGAHILSRGVEADAVFASSIVSSRLLAAMAAAAGIRHEETLTGFKWISRVAGLRYGYEEALGYCVDPDAVRDKDGIAAAVLAADLAATLKAAGGGLPGRLDELATAHGVHATAGLPVRMEPAARDAVVERLRARPPAGWAADRPAPDVLVLRRAGERAVIRPSGTEPKLKAYLQVVEPVSGDLPAARAAADARLHALRTEVEAMISGPGSGGGDHRV